MSKWLFGLLFLAALFFDGIISPALFGFRESFLTIIFLIVMLLSFEVNPRSLVTGVILSGVAAFYWGLKPGVLIFPLLASAGVLFLLNSFLNIKSKALMILSGGVMFIVFWGASVLIAKII